MIYILDPTIISLCFKHMYWFAINQSAYINAAEYLFIMAQRRQSIFYAYMEQGFLGHMHMNVVKQHYISSDKMFVAAINT